MAPGNRRSNKTHAVAMCLLVAFLFVLLAADVFHLSHQIIRVLFFLVGMLEKLCCHSLSMNAGGHKIMALIAQDADDLGGEGSIEKLNNFVAVGLVSGSYGSLLDIFPGAFT